MCMRPANKSISRTATDVVLTRPHEQSMTMRLWKLLVTMKPTWKFRAEINHENGACDRFMQRPLSVLPQHEDRGDKYSKQTVTQWLRLLDWRIIRALANGQ